MSRPALELFPSWDATLTHFSPDLPPSFLLGPRCSAKSGPDPHTKRIPAPLNQCHVQSFALKKKTKKKKPDNQLQTSSRVPRNQTALSFVIRGRMMPLLQQRTTRGFSCAVNEAGRMTATQMDTWSRPEHSGDLLDDNATNRNTQRLARIPAESRSRRRFPPSPTSPPSRRRSGRAFWRAEKR